MGRLDYIRPINERALQSVYDEALGRTGPGDYNLRDILPSIRYNIVDRHLLRFQADRLRKSLEIEDSKQRLREIRAREQGSAVGMSSDAYGSSSGVNGVKEKADVSFDALRNFAHWCEPAAAIVQTRVNQVLAYTKRATFRRGRCSTPGWRIRVDDPDAPTSGNDKDNIADIERFLQAGGWCDPPEDERPQGFVRGFEPYVSAVVRDSCTMDWTGTQRWGSKEYPDMRPLVAFAAIDAANIRYVERRPIGIEDGVVRHADFQGERRNARGKVTLAKVDGENGQIIAEYTKGEVAVGIRNHLTMESRNGYGYGELERGIRAMRLWGKGVHYNGSRFDEDVLPRGVLQVLGKMSEQQFDAFLLNFEQQMSGKKKRWGIPILRGNPDAGGALTWTPFDLSSREMEYHQMMFACSLWLHAICSIHPDETGYEALNPYRSSLGQPSPESAIKQSQDKGLDPILRWLESFITRELVWKLGYGKRYRFEFVGVEDVDELAEAQAVMAQLNAGMSTPRIIWAERDMPIPDSLKDAPWWDWPMTPQAAIGIMMQMQQQKQSQDMAERQQAAQEDMQQHSQDMAVNQAAAQGAQEQVDGDGASAGTPPGMAGPSAGSSEGAGLGTPLQKAGADNSQNLWLWK